MSTSPSTSLATLRPDLSGPLMQIDLEAEINGFVGLKIAPVKESKLPSGQYGVIEAKELLKTRETLRAADGSYARGGGKGKAQSFTTEEHGMEEVVDEREAAVLGEWWDAEFLAAQRARHAVLKNHNARVIAICDAVTYTNAAGTAWTTTASATPIANVSAAKKAMRDRIGIFPNKMVIDWLAFDALKNNAEIIDRIKYSGRDDPKQSGITANALAAILELDEVIVSGSVTNSANENQALSIAPQWTTSRALLFRASNSDDMKQPHYMRTIHWGGDGSTIGGLVESYRDEYRRADVIRCRMDTDEVEVYPEAAQVITGVTS